MGETRVSIGQYLDICHCPRFIIDEVYVVDERPHIAVIDDDESVREALPDLLRQYGYKASAFASGKEFLTSRLLGQIGCAILDVAMPGMSGPDLQRELTRRGYTIPIVFITGHGDEAMRPHVLKRGAVACLLKPFSAKDLLKAVKVALRMR